MPRTPTGRPRGRPKGSTKLGAETNALNVRVPQVLYEALCTCAHDVPLSAFVRRILEAYVAHQKQGVPRS